MRSYQATGGDACLFDSTYNQPDTEPSRRGFGASLPGATGTPSEDACFPSLHGCIAERATERTAQGSEA
jgi:hypothetical protein